MKPVTAARSLGECRLAALVESSQDAIATLDLEGRVIDWNGAAAKLCGYSAAEAVGEKLARLVVPVELMHEPVALMTAVSRGETVERRVVRHRKGGGRMLLSLRVAPVRDDLGAVAGSVWVARDVTDRSELERAERALASARRRRAWIAEALVEDGLAFAAQPLVDLASGQVARFELLMRMRRSGRVISPREFLGEAERSGQILALDRWAIRRGVALARAHPVAINISAASISDPRLPREFAAACELEGVDPSRITFEITETSAARDLEGAARLIGELNGLGCGVALDDFGTGFGTLTYLHRLPVTELKVDREFIGPDRPALDRRVVETVLATARIFEMRTVAEGVEDAAVLECLRELGIDMAQGYLLGAPQLVESADDLRALVPSPSAGPFLPAEGEADARPAPRMPVADGSADPWPGGANDAWTLHIRRLASERREEACRLRADAELARDAATRTRTERRRLRRARPTPTRRSPASRRGGA